MVHEYSLEDIVLCGDEVMQYVSIEQHSKMQFTMVFRDQSYSQSCAYLEIHHIIHVFVCNTQYYVHALCASVYMPMQIACMQCALCVCVYVCVHTCYVHACSVCDCV